MVNTLIKFRTQNRWSQVDLAREFGVSSGAVGMWETRKREIPGPVQKLLSLLEGAPKKGELTSTEKLKKIIDKIPTTEHRTVQKLLKIFAV